MTTLISASTVYVNHALHMKIIGKCGGGRKIKCHTKELNVEKKRL